MKPKKKLMKFIGDYADTSETELCPDYVKQMEIAVRQLERFAGREIRLRDLSDSLVNGFVDSLKQRGLAHDTISGRRGAILALWRRAFFLEILDCPPQRIRKLKNRRRIPQAWTHNDAVTLAAVAYQDKSPLRKIDVPRGVWFASLIMAGWDSALRLGDLLRLPYESIPGPGQPFVVTQHKTKDDVKCVFMPSTMSLIDECFTCGVQRELVWPLWANREQFYVQFKRIVHRSGVKSGTFRWLRRAAVTDVAKDHDISAGSKLAGHRGTAVTVGHYFDSSQEADGPRPAEIPLADVLGLDDRQLRLFEQTA